MAGIYIHIPFCKSRCIYCGFYSTTGRKSMIDRYVDCLLKELLLRSGYIYKEYIRTIYIGGGTPSLLHTEQIDRIRHGIEEMFPTMASAMDELTIECNPDDVTLEYATKLRDIGVTRVSMGAQTFSDGMLKFLGRRHNSTDISEAVENLRTAGIKNISIDLMFGFPEESLVDWEKDLDYAIKLDVEHISAYSLMYEEGTPLYRLLEEGRVKPLDEEKSREMFELLIDKLESAGYEHYEISNFAKPGYRAKHNSSYWHDVPYIGLGASAHSYNGRNRQWNSANITEYIHAIDRGEIPCESEDIDDSTHYNDLVTTAMRTKEGIDLTKVEEPFHEYLLENARKGIEYGNLCQENNHLHLTRQGLFISDDVMSDLIWA